jgi:hypothetical protein
MENEAQRDKELLDVLEESLAEIRTSGAGGQSVENSLAMQRQLDLKNSLQSLRRLRARDKAAQSPWIKTAERLPEEGQRCCWQFGWYFLAGEFYKGLFVDHALRSYHPNKVPHWHPLPPPPLRLGVPVTGET